MSLGRDDKPFDVLDLIINQLRKHERKIDTIVERLESIAKIDVLTHRRRRLSESVYQKVILKRWGDFKRRCADAEVFSFLVDQKRLKIMAMVGRNLNVYFEMLPELNMLYKIKDNSLRFKAKEIENIDHVLKGFRGVLDCGLRLMTDVIEVKKKDEAPSRIVVYSIHSQDVKTWLSNEMGVDPSFVIEGEISRDY